MITIANFTPICTQLSQSINKNKPSTNPSQFSFEIYLDIIFETLQFPNRNHVSAKSSTFQSSVKNRERIGRRFFRIFTSAVRKTDWIFTIRIFSNWTVIFSLRRWLFGTLWRARHRQFEARPPLSHTRLNNFAVVEVYGSAKGLSARIGQPLALTVTVNDLLSWYRVENCLFERSREINFGFRKRLTLYYMYKTKVRSDKIRSLNIVQFNYSTIFYRFFSIRAEYSNLLGFFRFFFYVRNLNLNSISFLRLWLRLRL